LSILLTTLHLDTNRLTESNKSMRKIISTAKLLSLGACLISTHAFAESKQEPTQALYPAGLVSLSDDNNFSNHSLIVNKATRTLSIYEWTSGKINKIAEFPADFGKNSGDKVKANDHRTPVGIYFLQKEMTQPEIPFDMYGNLAFATDYPNIFDKRDDKTGSGIWLHAVPDTVPLTRGSRGCVVVRNEVIKQIKSYIKLEQTPLLIFDDLQMLSEKKYNEQKNDFLKNFEQWRIAWEQQDVDTYIKFYDQTFRNDEMNYKQWYKHKKKLKSLYSFIKVQLSPPIILRNRDQVVIRTIQRYQSNLHQDYGEKTIHAHYSPEVGFRIIREDWKPLPDPLASQQAQPDSSSMNTKDKEMLFKRTAQGANPSAERSHQ